jgi:hypothetical protein
MRLTVLVKREQALDTGAWVWTALPQGFPGSAGGRTISELHEEVEALKHFFTGEDPATDIVVDYMYELPGLSIRDSAALMGLSKSRFEQICS